MKYSVIIRNRNEERWIGYAIQSFIDFFPKGEIIIVDNNSTDSSLEIVRLFDRYDIKIIDVDKYSPGKALNLGVQEATGDIVLIQSAHSVITKVDRQQLETGFKTHVAIFGNQIPYYLGKKITKRYVWANFKEEEEHINLFSINEQRHFLHNAFCFYKRDVLLDHPFDEQLHGKEDRYWAADIVKKGFTYLYNPSFSCNHHYTTNGATWKGIG